MRFFKKMTSVVLASFLLAFSVVSVNAESIESCDVMADDSELIVEEQSASEYESMISEMQLISEEETVDEEGNKIIDRIYSSTNGASPLSEDLSGTATYTHEKEKVFCNEEDPFVYSVTGTFSWNGEKGTASVKNVKYYHDPVPSNCELLDVVKESESNQGMNVLLGHKYAYIKYSFTYKNWAGYKDKASPLYLEVNAVGTITTT